MKPEWKNLAPGIVRQRVIIEGTTEKIVEPDQIKDYLEKLAEVTKMEKLSGPYAYSAHDMGWGWLDSLEDLWCCFLFISYKSAIIHG